MDYTWLITIAAIIGTVANIYKKQWCFIIWLVTNFLWMAIDAAAGLYSQAALFAVYLLLSVWGLYQWSSGGGKYREKLGKKTGKNKESSSNI